MPERSPNYPGYDLQTAVTDIKALYAKEHRSSFVDEVAAKDLGYAGLNGVVRRRLASLRQYGLLIQKGKRGGEAELSERALTLALRTESSPEYKRALREAALEPVLFRDFVESRLTSSDESLKHHLIVSRGFTDEGAQRFIQVFRQTMTYSNIAEDGKLPGQDVDVAEAPDSLTEGPHPDQATALGAVHPPSDATPVGVRAVLLPISPDAWAELRAPFPVTSRQWDMMVGILNVMKPSLVRDGEEETHA